MKQFGKIIEHKPYDRCLSFQSMWGYYQNFNKFSKKFCSYDSITEEKKKDIFKKVYIDKFQKDNDPDFDE